MSLVEDRRESQGSVGEARELPPPPGFAWLLPTESTWRGSKAELSSHQGYVLLCFYPKTNEEKTVLSFETSFDCEKEKHSHVT